MNANPPPDMYERLGGQTPGIQSVDDQALAEYGFPLQYFLDGPPPGPHLKMRTYHPPQVTQPVLLGNIMRRTFPITHLSFVLGPRGLPLMQSNAMVFQYNVMRYDRPLMQITAEEGVSDTFRSGYESRSKAIERRGVQFFCELNFASLPEGRRHVARLMQAAEEGKRLTFELDALQSIVSCRPQHYAALTEDAQRNSNFRDQLALFASQFCAAQKNAQGINVRIQQAKLILAMRDYKANAIYAHQRGAHYWSGVGARKVDYDKAGPSGPPLLTQDPYETTSIEKLPIQFINPYPENRIQLDLLRRTRMFGEYYTMAPLRPDRLFPELANYRTAQRDIMIHDFDRETEAVISLQDAIDSMFGFMNFGGVSAYGNSSISDNPAYRYLAGSAPVWGSEQPAPGGADPAAMTADNQQERYVALFKRYLGYQAALSAPTVAARQALVAATNQVDVPGGGPVAGAPNLPAVAGAAGVAGIGVNPIPLPTLQEAVDYCIAAIKAYDEATTPLGAAAVKYEPKPFLNADKTKRNGELVDLLQMVGSNGESYTAEFLGQVQTIPDAYLLQMAQKMATGTAGAVSQRIQSYGDYLKKHYSSTILLPKRLTARLGRKMTPEVFASVGALLDGIRNAATDADRIPIRTRLVELLKKNEIPLHVIPDLLWTGFKTTSGTIIGLQGQTFHTVPADAAGVAAAAAGAAAWAAHLETQFRENVNQPNRTVVGTPSLYFGGILKPVVLSESTAVAVPAAPAGAGSTASIDELHETNKNQLKALSTADNDVLTNYNQLVASKKTTLTQDERQSLVMHISNVLKTPTAENIPALIGGITRLHGASPVDRPAIFKEIVPAATGAAATFGTSTAPATVAALEYVVSNVRTYTADEIRSMHQSQSAVWVPIDHNTLSITGNLSKATLADEQHETNVFGASMRPMAIRSAYAIVPPEDSVDPAFALDGDVDMTPAGVLQTMTMAGVANQRLAMYDRVTAPETKRALALLLLSPLTQGVFHWWLDNHIPFPFQVVVARPAIVIDTATGIVGEFGENLGRYIEGPSRMTHAVNSITQTLNWNYTQYCGAVILRGDALVFMDDLYSLAYRRGYGAKWFRPDEWVKMRGFGFTPALKKGSSSLVAFLVPPTEQLDQQIDIRGKFPHEEDQPGSRVHFRTTFELMNAYGVRTHIKGGFDSLSSSDKMHMNILFRGAMKAWHPYKKDYSASVVSCSPLGPNTSHRMVSVLDGKEGVDSIFPECSYNGEALTFV